MNNRIPKVIHYCWFGDKQLGEKEKECIKSWKKVMPDYKIIEWNETNYDINKHEFLRQAKKYKKWAFISDYARLDIIYNHGGIYLDTDVEAIKRFDPLLENEAFFGFEKETLVANGLGFGAKKRNIIIKENLEEYSNIKFDINDLNHISCPKITTNILLRHGLKTNNKKQTLDHATVYPTEYFCPKDFDTEKLTITNNTYSIHHYSMTWHSNRDIRWKKIERKLSRLIGGRKSTLLVASIKAPGTIIINSKKYGLKNTLASYKNKINRTIKK